MENSFEMKMQRLDQIVKLLENNETGLKQSLELYEEGLMLTKELNGELENFENKIKELQGENNG